MPSLPPVPGVVKCVVSGTLDAIAIANVFHMGYNGQPPTGTQALGLATNMHAAWGASMAPHISVSQTMNLFQVFDLSSQVGSAADFQGAVPGTVSGPAVQNQVCMVLSKAIGRRYRGGHPRTYLGGMPTSYLQDQRTWNANSAALVAQSWAQFIQSLVGTTSWPGVTGEVVVHYHANHLPLNPPTVDSTQGAVANLVLGTQRRRLT